AIVTVAREHRLRRDRAHPLVDVEAEAGGGEHAAADHRPELDRLERLMRRVLADVRVARHQRPAIRAARSRADLFGSELREGIAVEDELLVRERSGDPDAAADDAD